MPTDDIPRKLMQLLLEMIASGELPQLAVGGAWRCVEQLQAPRPALAPVALEADICRLAIAGLREVGSAADWVVRIVCRFLRLRESDGCRDARFLCCCEWSQSISRGDPCKSQAVVASSMLYKGFTGGQPQRPDLEALVASGLFDECASAVAAVAAAGVEGLHDTNAWALCASLIMLRVCRSHPGCEAKIRQLAPALAFCLEHDVEFMEQTGHSSGTYAAQLCTRSYAKPPSHRPKLRKVLSSCSRTNYRLSYAFCRLRCVR